MTRALEIIRYLYREKYQELTDGEIWLLCGSRDIYYSLRRILLTTGVVTIEKHGHQRIWRFDWKKALRSQLFREIIEGGVE